MCAWSSRNLTLGVYLGVGRKRDAAGFWEKTNWGDENYAELVEKIKVFKVEVTLDELGDSFRTGMSANVEILGEKRDKAVSIPLEALQKRDGKTVAYRLKANLKPQQLAEAKDGLSGRNKFIWLSDHWKDYFDVVPVQGGIATLERVEILAGLKAGEEVALEDPTKKRVEKDEEDN